MAEFEHVNTERFFYHFEENLLDSQRLGQYGENLKLLR